MKAHTLIAPLVIWAGFSSVALSQMSTFPPPPSLAPSSDQSSNAGSNGPSSSSPRPPAAAPNPEQGSEPAMDNSSGVPAESTENTTGAAAGPGAASPPSSPSKTSTDDIIPVSASTLNSMTSLDDKVALEAGDRISFRVIEDRDEAVTRLVTDTGEVDFPYVGRLKVVGQTCRRVAEQLKKLLEVDYYKRATVIVGLDVIVGSSAAVVQHTPQVVWVVGQVRQVGPQALSKLLPLTVSQIILRAGGFGDFADERRVRLVHRATDTSPSVKTTGESQDAENALQGQVIDVKSVFEGRSTSDPVVQPNDLIIVPKKLINL